MADDRDRAGGDAPMFAELDLFALGWQGTPEEHRRIVHEVAVVLEIFAQANTMMMARRNGAPKNVVEALSVVQCAVMRFYYEAIPAEGWPEWQQRVFDTVRAHCKAKSGD